jgi:DNA-binding response OmpR family regulator
LVLTISRLHPLADRYARPSRIGNALLKGTQVKHRILVVDGDPEYRELLKFWLEFEGHEAILAETLEDGFIGIATPPYPDVVLLEIHLGNQNGLMLVHWARRQKHLAHIPIAAMAELANFKDLKSVAEAGCATCFTKPMDLRALRAYLAGLRVLSESKIGT